MIGHEVAMALRQAYLAMHRRTDALMARHGVTADQFVVMAALAEEDALSQRELVDRTSSDPSTLRAMLVLLERKGLVVRRPNPTDGRARSVTLTTRGMKKYRRLWDESQKLRDQMVAELSPDQAAALVAALKRLRTALAEEQPARISHKRE